MKQNEPNNVSFSEGRLQSDIFVEFWNSHPEYRGALFHIYSNPRSKIQGAQLKAMGMLKGMPDFCLAIPRNGFGSLYIELKLPGQKPKPEQLAQHETLRKHGNKVAVCWTKEEALKELRDYLSI